MSAVRPLGHGFYLRSLKNVDRFNREYAIESFGRTLLVANIAFLDNRTVRHEVKFCIHPLLDGLASLITSIEAEFQRRCEQDRLEILYQAMKSEQ